MVTKPEGQKKPGTIREIRGAAKEMNLKKRNIECGELITTYHSPPAIA